MRGPYVGNRLRTAIVQALLSVALTLLVAVPLAWFHHGRRATWSRVQLALHAAPFVLPVFVVVFGIQAVFGADGWTARGLGIDVLGTVGPLGAVVLAHTYYNYGFAARLLHAALERRPHALEEAARTLGASPRRALLRVTLPLLAPALGAVALLVFLFSFTSFGVVLYLGGGSVATLETLLYENLRGAFPRHDRAAALAIAQLAINLLTLAAYAALHRRVRLPAAPARPRPATARHVAVGTLWTLAGLAPAAAVLQGAFQVRGDWSLEPWRALLNVAHPSHLPGFDLGHALRLSLLYGTASAATSLALTITAAYGLRRLGPRARRLADTVGALPLGTSSLLMGFGLVLTFGVQGFLHTGTGRLLIIAAHALVSFPFTLRAILPALEQHDTRLDEAARLLGARPAAVLLRVHWPRLRGPVLAAAGLAVAMSLGDFGASLLLMNTENRSLSVWIDRHAGVAAFDPVVRAQADALAAVLMLLAAAAYLAVERFGGDT